MGTTVFAILMMIICLFLHGRVLQGFAILFLFGFVLSMADKIAGRR